MERNGPRKVPPKSASSASETVNRRTTSQDNNNSSILNTRKCLNTGRTGGGGQDTGTIDRRGQNVGFRMAQMPLTGAWRRLADQMTKLLPAGVCSFGDHPRRGRMTPVRRVGDGGGEQLVAPVTLWCFGR